MANPLNHRGSESSTQLAAGGPAFSQFIAFKKKAMLWTFMNYLDTGSSDNAESMGAGAPEFGEVNTSEIGSVLYTTNADSYGSMWFLPEELDTTKAMNFRVFWSESGTGGSGSALYTVKYTELITETTAVAIGATAISATDFIAADTPSTTAHCLQATAQGTLAANTLTAGGAGVNALAMITYVTLTTITDASAYALEVEYERRFVG